MSQNRTIEDRAIDYIRAKEKKTKLEVQFLNLLDAATRTPGDTQLFEAYLSEHISRQRTRERQKARSRVQAQHRKAEGETARKARTKAMVEAAGLLGMAGFLNTTTGLLHYETALVLGVLLAAKRAVDAPDKRSALQQEGERFLRERATRPTADHSRAIDPPAIRSGVPVQPASGVVPGHATHPYRP